MTAVGVEGRVDLRRLLTPGSIAVVGATDRPGAYGAQALENLQTVGFEGEVWGINPRRDEVMGFPCVASVAELPVAVDALVVAIPAAGVPEVIEQAGAQRLRWRGRDQRRLRRGAGGRRAQPRAAGRRGSARTAGLRTQLQWDRVAAQPHLAVGRRARRA